MRTSNFPLVSIIIASKNEERSISRVLKSIRKQTYPHREIIVVDNHSTDKTVMLAKSYTFHVYTKGGERSAQRNFGAEKAQGQFFLFLDADMELLPRTVADCVTTIRSQRAAALVIPETVKGSGFFARVKILEKRMYEGESLIEAARFFWREVFIAVGGYDESLVAGEDWDLSQRARIKGIIGRTTTPLFHNEMSFWRELKHKMYYAKHISKYARFHPQQFALQSGNARLRLFWRKRQLLASYPIETLGLFLGKGLEYGMYRLLTLLI